MPWTNDSVAGEYVSEAIVCHVGGVRLEVLVCPEHAASLMSGEWWRPSLVTASSVASVVGSAP